MNVKVEAEEEDDGDEEGDEGQEDELLQEAGLFELDSEFVLLLGQLVVLSLQKGVANVIHVDSSLLILIITQKLIINRPYLLKIKS